MIEIVWTAVNIVQNNFQLSFSKSPDFAGRLRLLLFYPLKVRRLCAASIEQKTTSFKRKSKIFRLILKFD